MLLSDLGTSLKLRRVTYGVFAFVAIHEEQFPLPRYTGIGDASVVASEARTNDSKRVSGQEGHSEATVTTFVSRRLLC